MSIVVQSSLKRFARSTALLYATLAFLLVFFFVGITFKLEQRAVLQQEQIFNEQQFLQTQIAARAFQQILDDITRFSLQLESHFDIDRLDKSRTAEQLNSGLLQTQDFQQEILGVLIYNAQQTLLLSTLDEKKNNNLSLIYGTVNAWIQQNWVALASPEITSIVPVFHVTENEQFFAILRPIRRSGIFTAVSVTVADLSYLSQQYIKPLRSGEYGAAFMLNEQGVVIYDHETEIIGRSVFDDLHKSYPDLQRIDQRLVTETSGQDEYYFSASRLDSQKTVRKLISWHSIKIDTRRLVIALSAPDTEITRPIEKLRQQAIILALLLAFGLMVITALFFKKDLYSLRRTAKQLETELTLRDQALSKAEKNYSEMIENAAIGIYRTTPDGRLLQANPYLVRLNACESEEELILIANFNDDRWYKENDRRLEFKKKMEKEGYVEGFVSQIKSLKNREDKWVSETARAVRDEEGNILFYEGTMLDVTHLVHTEEARNKSDANLRAHITAMPDLGIIYSRKGDVIDIYGDQKLLFLNKEQMIGRNLKEMAGSKAVELWMDIIGKTIATEKVQNLEYFMPMDGAPRWFEARSALIIDKENTCPSVVILIRDITQRHLDQEALITALENADLANRSKSEFLANMSHELRTPLNAILGYSEIMEQQLLGPLENKKYLGYVSDIHSSGALLLEIINDILDLSKIEAGRYTLEEENINLAEVVEQTNRIIKGTAAEKNLEFDINRIPAFILYADARALKQILLNLLSNAIKFTPAGGKVILSASQENSGIQIKVTDTGIGMEPHDLARIFEPFFRVGQTMTTEVSGTGIGLALTRKLVEFHQGTLEIQSTIDEGTTATVTLPLARLIGRG
ncbi:ATP-binding protein [Kiloniella laminariae]|uniref:histidine kinase n=1 Tax=Kiloniella laminariae TaxID=454162 RepID=A0ABT4LNL1_9PROT|nr:ATP-binding protein [Kiloniella laminariae]MCZ4282678.1 ATP-binding protein [Kiloniella laminariae]